MNKNIDVREAQLEDSEAMAQIQVASYHTAYAGLLPQTYLDHFTVEEQTQDWCDLIRNKGHDLLYVAETGRGEIAGYALGRPGQGEMAPYDSELVALHVRRAHQRQGVGRKLVATMAERLKRQGCSSLMLWVLAENPARRFYERLGGQLVGQKPVHLGEGESTVVEVAYGWLIIENLCG